MKTTTNTFLLACVFFTKTFSAQCFYPAPPDGLVASYYFNNNLVETVSNSSSGTSNNGVSYTTDRFGNANSALNFGNTNSTNSSTKQYVSLNNPAIFAGDFTIVYWFRSGASQNNRRMYLFSIDSAAVSNNLNLEMDDTYAFWCYWNSGGLPGFAGETINQYQDSVWHMAAFRRTGGTIEFFIDMVLKATDTGAGMGLIGSNAASNGGKIILGYNNSVYPPIPNYFDGFGFNGQIDDLSLYNTSVSTSVLENYYNNYDLVAYFPFTGGLTDQSGNNNAAVLDNSTGNSSDSPVLTANRFGLSNHAYHFNGNGFIKIDPFSSNSLFSCLDFFSNDFTVSFWCRSNLNNKRMFAFSVDNNMTSTYVNNLAIEFNDSDYPMPGFWTYWNGQGIPGITAGAMNKYSDSLWHLVTLTRKVSHGVLTAYIDSSSVGSYVDSSSTVIGSNSDYMDIGHYRGPYAIAHLNFNNYGFVGDIDEVKFYRHAFTHAEVKNSYGDTISANRVTALITNFADANTVTVYPNPNAGIFQIKTAVAGGQVVILNSLGRVIQTASMAGKAAEVDISRSAPGVYFIMVYDTNHLLISNQKLIKE